MMSTPSVAATPIPTSAAVESPSFFLLLELVAVAVARGSTPELDDELLLDDVAVDEASDFCVPITSLAVCNDERVVW